MTNADNTADNTPATPLKERNYTAQEWRDTEKQIDDNFAGSVFERLGFSNALCPACGAHLSGPDSIYLAGTDAICLNGCHMGAETRDMLRCIFSRATNINYITDLVPTTDNLSATDELSNSNEP